MRIWEKFPGVADAVRKTHEEVGLVGAHDWVHAFRVGAVANQIALEEYTYVKCSAWAGLAGLCHSVDRIIQKRDNLGRRDAPEEQVEELVLSWLSSVDTPLEKAGVREIVEAVLRHEQRNGPDDSTTLIVLMDADRIVNLSLDLVIRAGQHYHDLPAVDFRHFLSDPMATYSNPGSVARDIAYALEWAEPSSPVCVRTSLGKKMAQSRAKILRRVLEDLQEQLEDEEVYPYPFLA